MKRVKAVLAILGCLCLWGCGAPHRPPQTTGFTSVVSFSAGELAVTAELRRTDVGQLHLTCLTPPTLAGWNVTLDGERLALARDSLRWEATPESFPATAPFLLLCRALDAVACKADLPDNGGVTEGVCDGMPYRLTFDPKTGVLMKLELPNRNISVAFSDFLST